MKHLSFYIVILGLPLVVGSCNFSKEEHKGVGLNEISAQKTDTTSIRKTETRNDSTDLFKFGQAIIDNKIIPTDNDLTFACLDSMHTHSTYKTRQFFFNVYRVIAKKSDGALSEVIGAHLKEYLFNFPNEGLDNYRLLGKKEQQHFIEFMGYEFYASNRNEKEIDSYFGSIMSSSLYISSNKNDTLLENIRIQVVKYATELQDS